MTETALTVRGLNAAAQRILDQFRQRLPPDGVWLVPYHPDLQAQEDERAPFTLTTALRTAVQTTVPPGTDWILGSLLEQLVDQLLHGACGADFQDWTRLPGRTHEEVQDTIAAARAAAAGEPDAAALRQAADQVFAHMADLPWTPGERSHGVVLQMDTDGRPQAVPCSAFDPRCDAWTTPGAFDRALRDAAAGKPRPQAISLQFACHLRIQATTGAAELEDATAWQPFTQDNDRDLARLLRAAPAD